MLFDDLNQVPASVEKAIVINVNTEIVSALAIASALRYSGMPLLVVNCTPAGPARQLMDSLAEAWNFDLVNLQLAPHGVTIDRLFEKVFADRILLLDSDAELRSPLVTARMRHAFGDSAVYGAGWVHDSDWLSPEQSGVQGAVVYRERPWIPCSMFRTSYMRAGINAGKSFLESFIVGGSILSLGLESHYLANGLPLAVHNDTGADMHWWAKNAGFRFDGPSVHTIVDEVAHLHGVTRSVMAPGGPNASQLSDVESGALERLRNLYPELWAGFAAAVEFAQR